MSENWLTTWAEMVLILTELTAALYVPTQMLKQEHWI